MVEPAIVEYPRVETVMELVTSAGSARDATENVEAFSVETVRVEPVMVEKPASWMPRVDTASVEVTTLDRARVEAVRAETDSAEACTLESEVVLTTVRYCRVSVENAPLTLVRVEMSEVLAAMVPVITLFARSVSVANVDTVSPGITRVDAAREESVRVCPMALEKTAMLVDNSVVFTVELSMVDNTVRKEVDTSRVTRLDTTPVDAESVEVTRLWPIMVE